MAYIDQAQLADDVTFQERVSVAMTKAAIAIQNEALSIPNHTQRAVFAHSILHNLDAYKQRFAMAVTAANLTMTGSVTDVDLQTAIDSVWDAFAFAKVS